MSKLIFASSDPSLLKSVIMAKNQEATKLAPTIELWNWADAYEAANPHASEKEYRDAFFEHKQFIEQQMAGKGGFDFSDAVNDGLTVASATVKIIPFEHAEGSVEGLIDYAKAILNSTPVQDLVHLDRSEKGAEATSNIIADYNGLLGTVVEAVAPKLRDNPEFNKAMAQVFPDIAAGRQTIPTTPDDVLQAHNDVFNQTIIKQFTVQADSGLSAQIDNVQQTLSDHLSDISTKMQEQYTSLHGDIAQLQAGQKVLLDYVSDQKTRQAQAAAAAAKQAQYEVVFAGAQTAVNVLASVANLVDPKLGRQIGQVGAASVQVGRAAVDMVKAVTNCMSATLNAASALGAAVATGNFIGAALNLVNIFTGLGAESPDQMILEQIGKLRQQIDTFHQDMTARFDQVDRELNTIYNNVMSALNKIDIQLGQIQDTVDHILSDVVVEQIKLDRIIRSLDAYFTNQYRLPLQIAINTDLGWPSDHPMSMDEFMRARGVFYTFACEGAYADPQETPVDNRPTDNASLANELSGPADQNIAFANHVLAIRGWPTFAPDTPGGRLPNPLTWSIAAAAYAQLEAEQQALAAAAVAGETHSKRDDVRAGGLALAQASETLRSLMIPSASGLPLLDMLLSNYTSAVHEWATDVDLPSSYKQWQEYLRTQVGQQTDLNLWGGPDQDFGYTPPGLSLSPNLSTAPATKLPAPANLRSKIPATFLVADWLGLGKLSVTYTPNWDVKTRMCGHDPETHQPIYCDYYTFVLGVTITYQNVPLWSSQVRGPTYNDSTLPDSGAVPDSYDATLQANWTGGVNYKAQIEKTPGYLVTGADALTTTTRATVTSRINGVRVEYFSWINTQSSAPTSSIPEPLFYPQAAAIDGARALLDLLIALAFEQPRYGDDLLRALFDGASQPSGLRLPGTDDLLAAVMGLDPSSFSGSGPAITPLSDTLIATPQQLILQRLQQWQDAAAKKLWKPILLAAERNLLRLNTAEAIITAEEIAHGKKK